jgi:formylglycine-generating enzyme required for sulfatase activity
MVNLMYPRFSFLLLFVLIMLPQKYAETSINEPSRRQLFINSIGMKFVKIPNGNFIMGCREYSDNCSGCYCLDDEQPAQQIYISKPFYMGVTEVTQGQWQMLMGDNPSLDYECGQDCPVENVSYNEVQSFIKKLSIKEGNKYRLPTNAEWEYATRAGTTTAWSSGNSIKTLRDYAWTVYNSSSSIHPVGRKNPNPWGLYDVHGNVSEMTSETIERFVPIREFKARGGHWDNTEDHARSAYIAYVSVNRKLSSLGFRLVKVE